MSGFELGVREMVISKDTSGFSMNVMRGKFERQESITDMTSSGIHHFSLLLPSTVVLCLAQVQAIVLLCPS